MALGDYLRDALRSRAQKYRAVFRGPVAEDVLADLAAFCRAHETTFNADPRLHAVLEGRREVWLRIANHLNLSEEALIALYERRLRNDNPGQ